MEVSNVAPELAKTQSPGIAGRFSRGTRGGMETGLPALQCPGPLQVTIERLPDRTSPYPASPLPRIHFNMKGIEHELAVHQPS